MTDQERLAHALQERLGGRIEGGGVNCSVEVGDARRACRVACFWYGGRARAEYTGPEYLVRFDEAERRIAGGRTRDVETAVAVVRAWLDGRSIESVQEAWPFVDAKRRRLRELLAILEPACGDVARCEIAHNTTYELWAYGRGRSCRLIPGAGGSVSAWFDLGPARVAHGDVSGDPAALASRWLRGATLRELAAAGMAIDAHAELLERGDVAAWHWLHVRDQVADPDDNVLARSRPLIERLAARELPARFFSFTSMDRFCFAASSHFPWVREGLPLFGPPGADGRYVIEVGSTRTACDLDGAIGVIETALAASPVAPFFGCAAHVTAGALDAALANAGSPLRAELRQCCGTFVAAVVRGDRICTVGAGLRFGSFRDAADPEMSATFASTADLLAALSHWLDDGLERRPAPRAAVGRERVARPPRPRSGLTTARAFIEARAARTRRGARGTSRPCRSRGRR